jgi:[acyl-carrier-protein] S-malonyltransferase
MNTSAILFPGQGAQAIGMGSWLCENHSAAADLFAQAGDVLGYDLRSICENGPSEKLNSTEYCQPALFVVGIAAATVLKAEQPQRIDSVGAAAGLSLGEYTAVCFAGGLEFGDALRLVQKRGQAMQAASDAAESGMASVLGLELQTLQGLCEQCREGDEILQPANLLCPGNIAVSGHKSAIEKLIPVATEAGAMKVIPLAVAGAFHTPIMQSAVETLKAALDEISIADTCIPVYSNVDAKPHTSASEIRDLLSRQVVGSVLWEASVRQMMEDGVDRFEEVGTGRVLRGTLKRINRKVSSDGFGDG